MKPDLKAIRARDELAHYADVCIADQHRWNATRADRRALLAYVDELRSRLAEAELDKEHLQRAVNRACEVFREDVLMQDIDSTTRGRVELYIATYGGADSATHG